METNLQSSEVRIPKTQQTTVCSQFKSTFARSLSFNQPNTPLDLEIYRVAPQNNDASLMNQSVNRSGSSDMLQQQTVDEVDDDFEEFMRNASFNKHRLSKTPPMRTNNSNAMHSPNSHCAEHNRFQDTNKICSAELALINLRKISVGAQLLLVYEMTTPVLRDHCKRKSIEPIGDETIIPETPDNDVAFTSPSNAKRMFSQENIIGVAARFNDGNPIETQFISLVETNDEEISNSPTKIDAKVKRSFDRKSLAESEQLFDETEEAENNSEPLIVPIPTKCIPSEKPSNDDNSLAKIEHSLFKAENTEETAKKLEQIPTLSAAFEPIQININEIIAALTNHRTQSNSSYTSNQLSTDALIALHSKQCQLIDSLFEDVAISMQDLSDAVYVLNSITE